MRLLVLMLVLCAAAVVSGEPPADDTDSDARKPDELFLRTGILLNGIPVEAPEDKLYPVEDNLFKLDEYHRTHGIRLKAGELARFERAFRQWGRSDGVFNVPERIRRMDEWDAGTYTVANRNKQGELVPLSDAEITESRVDARPYALSRRYRSYSTLGMLAKHCDGAFIGEVVKVTFKSPAAQAEIAEGIFPEVQLSFCVMTNLFGNIPSSKVIIPSITWQEEYVPVVGMKLLFFYSRGYTIDLLNRDSLKFGWEKPPAVPGASPGVMLDRGSHVRLLDNPEIERAYTEAAIGYLRLLRREKRNPAKYYELLRPLVNSPVWRIRQDAKEDLLRLLRFVPDELDLYDLLDDPELIALFKDYVRYIAIPACERRKAEAVKEE